MWIYPIGKKMWGSLQDARFFLYKLCKISHLGDRGEKTDGGFRDQRILRINNF